jgi:pimeloyl-ACP methyl ester carboxylesterase
MSSSDTRSPRDVIGHEMFGSGPVPVVVLNDWLCDTTTWDGARAYLDRERFTWVFADLRGYGRSRGRSGSFTVAEAARDVIDLADARDWERFAIVGHSMSCLVALHLAQQLPDRVLRVITITPPPPAGFGADEAGVEVSRALVRGDDAMREAALKRRFGTRLSPGWAAFKAARWRATSDDVAASAYVAMFARDGLPNPAARVAAPVLAITGEQDFEPMRSAGVRRSLSPLCETLEVVAFADSGHYPMQEMPPLLVAHVERFLGAEPGSPGPARSP